MDEMRLKLTTKFMRKIAAKLLSRYIYKEHGYKIDIRFDELDVWFINGDTTVRANVELKMNGDDFKKIIQKADLD